MMDSNTFIMRFAIGGTYRLRTSPAFPQLLSGTMTVRSEIHPTDMWGNRILLADFRLVYPDGHEEIRQAERCFVQEGYTPVKDSYGERVIPTEIATTIHGQHPFAKAYASDGIAARVA